MLSRERLLAVVFGALSCASSLVLTMTARAHGDPPEVMGIVSADAYGPTVLLLNEGLAFRDGDHYTYLCPSLWGDTRLTGGGAPRARGDGVTTWVVGASAVYTLEGDALERLEEVPIDGRAAVSIVERGADLYALLLTTGGSELVPIQGGAPALWTSSTLWPACDTRGDGFLLARAADGIELLMLDATGAELERTTVPLQGEITGVRVRTLDADTLYLGFSEGAEYVLGEVSLEDLSFVERARSELPIHGPERAPDGTTFIAHGGSLLRLQGDGTEPVAAQRDVSCLGRWRDVPYVCLGNTLHALTGDGVGGLLYDLAGLHGLEAARIPASAEPECGFQWQLFENDLERAGLAPVTIEPAGAGAAQDDPTSATTSALHAATVTGAGGGDGHDAAPGGTDPAAGGCSAAHGGDHAAERLLWLIAGCLAWLRRRRAVPTARPPCETLAPNVASATRDAVVPRAH